MLLHRKVLDQGLNKLQELCFNLTIFVTKEIVFLSDFLSAFQRYILKYMVHVIITNFRRAIVALEINEK